MWKYSVIKVDRHEELSEKMLNDTAAAGWELAFIVPLSESWDDYIEGREISGVYHYNQLVFKRLTSTLET